MVLAREGNLGVVSWLDADSRGVIEEIAAQEISTLWAELRCEYLESTATPDHGFLRNPGDQIDLD